MRRRKKINKIWIIAGIAFVVLIGLVVFVRIRNLKKNMENDPVQTGEVYEKFDKGKAEDLLTRYFEGMAKKDMDVLSDVFYSKDVLTTFAKYNEISEQEVLDTIKKEVDELTVNYKELSIKEYSAYKDSVVASYNEHIEEYAGTKNCIEYMYLVAVTYMQNTTIGWEEKTQDIRVYVTDGEYHVWPTTGE